MSTALPGVTAGGGLCVEDNMEQKLLGAPYSLLRATDACIPAESAPIDLIFVQDLGLVPKRIITSNSPIARSAAERKWLGTDFSHVIVSQQVVD